MTTPELASLLREANIFLTKKDGIEFLNKLDEVVEFATDYVLHENVKGVKLGQHLNVKIQELKPRTGVSNLKSGQVKKWSVPATRRTSVETTKSFNNSNIIEV